MSIGQDVSPRSRPTFVGTIGRWYRPEAHYVVRRGLDLGGLAVGLVFFCLSLTPSLLPRSWVLQGMVSGVTASIGYGIGSLVSAAVRRAVPRRWIPPWLIPSGWALLVIGGTPTYVSFVWLGNTWQDDLRRRMDMPTAPGYNPTLIAVVGGSTFLVILLAARLMRLFTRTLNTWLARRVPEPLAVLGGLSLSVFLIVGTMSNVVAPTTMDIVNRSFSISNNATTAGVTQPLSAMKSGSPASAVPWDTMGTKGRDFVGVAPSARTIESFTGRAAEEPVRVYVGLESADGFEKQAALAVRELERTRGLDRAVIAVATTTGTGWVDQRMADSLEYMYGGDTAIVAMQYSFLPSWLSFLVDRDEATASAKALIDAVADAVRGRPPGQRPRLVVFGESLGAYGIETTFGTLDELTTDLDGALLVGPPFNNPIRNELIARRDAGTTVWQPVYGQGRTVRFASTPRSLATPEAPWTEPRVVYLQNSTDPIVWWNPDLMFERPQWLQGRRAPDVSAGMDWYPFITFWQVTVDMLFANGVPPGHGHRYGANVIYGWTSILEPPDWSTKDSQRLAARIDVLYP